MTSSTDSPVSPFPTAPTDATSIAQTAAFSQLLLSLYAAALDDAQWRTFLTQLCEATGSFSAFLMRNDASLGNQVLAGGGIPLPPKSSEHYHENVRYTDPFRVAYLRNPRTGVIEGEEILPYSEFVATDYYRERVANQGWHYMTTVVISFTPRSQQLLSLWRGDGRPYLDPHQREVLDLLLPHLENAARIRQTIGRAEDRALNAEAALDASTAGSILLDAKGQILHMNHSAEQMVVAADALRVHISRIVPVDPSQRGALDALILKAADARMCHAGGSLMLMRRGGKRPLHVLVTPLRLTGGKRSTVRVLVLVTDPDREVRFPDAALRALYGLTAAETEIANGMMTGLSVEEIAQLRRVSIATVRSQLKPLLGKTGTRRQADLVRLLSTLPRTAPAGEPAS